MKISIDPDCVERKSRNFTEAFECASGVRERLTSMTIPPFPSGLKEGARALETMRGLVILAASVVEHSARDMRDRVVSAVDDFRASEQATEEAIRSIDHSGTLGSGQ